VFAGGCVFENSNTEMVVMDKVSVTLDEYRTSGSIGSAVVVEDFVDQFNKMLEKYDTDKKEIVSIGIVSGSYRTTMIGSSDQGWTITSSVTVRRQDDPMGPVTDGPATFVNMTSQPLVDARGAATYADLNSDGVALIGRAMEDLLAGESPRLILGMEGGTISPAPTMENPLAFRWTATVFFQIVVNKGN